MKTYNLVDVLIPEDLTSFEFTATYGDDEYTIFTTDFFLSEIYQHFASRKVRLAGVDPAEEMRTLFRLWKSSREETYARRAYALSIEYEPLENYDRMEERTGSSETVHGETITRTHNNTDTRTHNNTDTTTLDHTDALTRTGSDSIQDKRHGVNSTVAVPTTGSETAYNSGESTAHTGTVEDEHRGTIADAHTGTIADAHTGKDSGSDSYTLRAHGNIGVTTAAQMLAEDLGALRYDLALTAICDFADRYTYEVEGLNL